MVVVKGVIIDFRQGCYDCVDKFYEISLINAMISKINNNTRSMMVLKKKLTRGGVINGSYLSRWLLPVIKIEQSTSMKIKIIEKYGSCKVEQFYISQFLKILIILISISTILRFRSFWSFDFNLRKYKSWFWWSTLFWSLHLQIFSKYYCYQEFITKKDYHQWMMFL